MEGEIWKDIVGYEGLYQCSNKGRIKSLDRTVATKKGSRGFKELKGTIRKTQNRLGYRTITLFKDNERKSYYIHRLVAEVFIPNPSAFSFVNHKDESRDNNKTENLEWCSHQYNISYGTILKRKSEKLSRIVEGTHVTTGEKVTFKSMTEAGRNGFSQSNISLCCNGKKEKYKNYKWKFKTERGD